MILSDYFRNIELTSLFSDNMDSSERLRLVINSCNVPLVIDKRTIGDGNCFPRGIVQQLQRREVKRWMTVNKPIAYTTSHVNLRKNV